MTEHDEMTVGEEQTEDGKFMRRIRSFVRREGRLTRGQDRALQELWPVMGVEFRDEMLDLPSCLVVKRQWCWKSVLAWVNRWWKWQRQRLRKISSGSKCIAPALVLV